MQRIRGICTAINSTLQFIAALAEVWSLVQKQNADIRFSQFWWILSKSAMLHACLIHLCIILICIFICKWGLRKRSHYDRTAWSFVVFLSALIVITAVVFTTIAISRLAWWWNVFLVLFGITTFACVSMTVFPGFPYLKELWVRLSNPRP